MSTVERNKGKLTPTGVDTELFTEDDWDTIYENGFLVIAGEVYQVEYEVKSEKDYCDFAEVKENEDGSIDFHTLHYNGGASLGEVIEYELERQFKESR